ncbi:MAG: hypothetical protein SPL52_06030 [Fibrobacter sp.]|nr:hypothetical protein [Fibrobacter sp.]
MKETIKKAEEVLQKLEASSKSGDRLFSFLLKKCIYQTALAFERTEKSLNELCAVTRYNLEALIDIKLCSLNEGFTLAMEFNQKQVFIDLYKVQLLQYQREVSVMKDYQKKEENIIGEITRECIENKNLEVMQMNKDEKIASLDESFLDEAIYFTDKEVFYDGYGFMAYHIENKIIPQIEKKIEQLETEQIELAEKAKNDLLYQFLFDLTPEMESSEVSSKVEFDIKKWNKKAEKAGLIDEYEFIYRYTSCIIHCVGLSFFSKKEVDDNDIKILETASKRYIRLMTNILQQRLSEDDIKIFLRKEKVNKQK